MHHCQHCGSSFIKSWALTNHIEYYHAHEWAGQSPRRRCRLCGLDEEWMSATQKKICEGDQRTEAFRKKMDSSSENPLLDNL